MTSDLAGASVRVAEAERRAEERLRRQRDLLRPLGWAVIAVVVATVVTQRPIGSGTGVAVGIVAAVFAGATAAAIGGRFLSRRGWVQVAVVCTMAAAGVALSWLQPLGATDLAAGVAAWMAITRLPLPAGFVVASLAGVGQAAATARTGSTSAVVAVVLLTVLLGLVAYLMRQGRDAQTQTELLLAQLADARDAQAEAAVVAERGRIAAELHDVLAHALSGAALQLQGARLLADRAQPDPRLVEAIERAARLVADGLVNARRAVRTLRGAELPSLTQLDQLVADARRDLRLDITLEVNGTPTPLPPEQALALYRGVEEALTNAARHAPGAAVRVEVEYRPADTTIQVQNTPPTPAPTGTPEYPSPDLARLGGGNGLAGLHERLQHLGGSVDAGPHEGGWRVRLTVPTPRPTIPTRRAVRITTPAGPVIPR